MFFGILKSNSLYSLLCILLLLAYQYNLNFEPSINLSVPSALFIVLITSYKLVLSEGRPSCKQGIPHRRNHYQVSFFESQLRISCRLF